MLKIAAIVLCTLALPGVLGARLFPWHNQISQFGEVGGLDPDVIKRHAYFLGELCPSEPRVMSFGDEIMLLSQRPWEQGYKTNYRCKVNVTTENPNVGLIVKVLMEDTETCEDFLRVTVPNLNETYLFCGPRTNVTGISYMFANTSVLAEWVAIAREKSEQRGHGFNLLFTAYQNECFHDQTCFPCSNGLIIDQLHMCNGLDNCGDASDEYNCRYYPGITVNVANTFSWLAILMTVVAVLLVVGLAVVGNIAFRFYRERNAARHPPAGEEQSLFGARREAQRQEIE